MRGGVAGLLAPHYCSSCGDIGALLCESCKYDIVSDGQRRCLICRAPTTVDNLCSGCHVPYSRAWYVAEREGSLGKLLDLYKFQRAAGAYVELAELLDHILPELPPDTVVVHIPTIAAHVRQRGYDHTKKIARELARSRKLAFRTPIIRATNTHQRGAGRAVRIAQASEAFAVRGDVGPVPHLIIDDVVTTGATVEYAASVLKNAGASEVWVAVVSRQPLD